MPSHPLASGDCLQPWANKFYQIITRYEDTISAQFYGHTHHDSFQLFYVTENGIKRAASVAYIAPSVTTSTDINPSFRIYTMDVATKAIINTDTYHTDLIEANKLGKPNWVHVYNAKDAYNMTNLFPADWDNLAQRLSTYPALFSKFIDYYNTGVASGPCTGDCVKDQICSILSGESSMYDECMKKSNASPMVKKWC